MLEQQYKGASFEYVYIPTRKGVMPKTLITAHNVTGENLAQVIHQARVQDPKAISVYTDWYLNSQTALDCIGVCGKNNAWRRSIYVCLSDISTYFGSQLEDKPGIPIQESHLAGLKPNNSIKFIPITDTHGFGDLELSLLESLLNLYAVIGHDNIMILPQEFKSVESMKKLVGETAMSRDHIYLYDVVYNAITDIQSGNKEKVKEMLNMAKELGMPDDKVLGFARALYIS